MQFRLFCVHCCRPFLGAPLSASKEAFFIVSFGNPEGGFFLPSAFGPPRQKESVVIMANPLDEMNGPVSHEGHEVRVIQKALPVRVGLGSLLFEAIVCGVGFIPALMLTLQGGKDTQSLLVFWVGGAIPAAIYFWKKMTARNYFAGLEQRIQAASSEIDNYLRQRVQILQNVAALVTKAVNLDQETMTAIAQFRGGCGPLTEGNRSDVAAQLNTTFQSLMPHMEAYPELQAHASIRQAMNENGRLQREITAARTLQNDLIRAWNRDVFQWPVKQIVAARAQYTTRIPFSIGDEERSQARGVFFK